nr:hypothetical protein [Tanacetum cinerariifolium]
MLYWMRRVRGLLGFPLGQLLDEDLTSLSRFFFDIEQTSGGGGGRRVKEKQQGSTNITTPATSDLANNTIKDTVMVSSDGDELNEALGPNPDTSTPKVVNEVGKNDVGTGPAISTPNPGLSSYANVTGAGETKNLKTHGQTPKGVLVGQKVRFKPTKQVFHSVPKKPTTNTSRNKKKNMEPTKVDGYGTQSLPEQLKESYENGDYEYDPYDDDMYKD